MSCHVKPMALAPLLHCEQTNSRMVCFFSLSTPCVWYRASQGTLCWTNEVTHCQSHRQSLMQGWDANSRLPPAHLGLFQTWLSPSLPRFLQDAERGQEHRLRPCSHSNSSFISHLSEPRFLPQKMELITYLLGHWQDMMRSSHMPSRNDQHIIGAH